MNKRDNRVEKSQQTIEINLNILYNLSSDESREEQAKDEKAPEVRL